MPVVGEGSPAEDGEQIDNDEETLDDRIRVCLRFRPMNKLEASRRSRNCVDVHRDGQGVAVDSPLEGEFDFDFDRVFRKDASQEEVYDGALSPVASNLLRGYNCTVMAYGQTGSGKTHTMMGAGGRWRRRPKRKKNTDRFNMISSDGKEDFRSHEENGDNVPEHCDENGGAALNQRRDSDGGVNTGNDEEMAGMIPRTVRAVFTLMEESSPNIEYTVRCSFVEIYLEKILDLLNPGGKGMTALSIADEASADEAAGVGASSGSGISPSVVRIDGASEACCLDESDVLSLLIRGNACRTVSNTKMNTDSSRSHAIFIMKIEQRNTETGITKNSVLHMVDLAGSELSGKNRRKSGRRQVGVDGDAVEMETKMINKSVSALGQVVRNLTEMAKQENSTSRNTITAASIEPHRQSKLTRLLRPAFGGNCLTTILLTASPYTYNISETLATIRFGQNCRLVENAPVMNSDSPDLYKKKLADSEKKRMELMSLVKALASEYRIMKKDDVNGQQSKENNNRSLWDRINNVLESQDDRIGGVTATWKVDSNFSKRMQSSEIGDGGTEPQDAVILPEDIGQCQLQLMEMRKELSSTIRERVRAENLLAELQSEVAVLRSQNEHLNSDKKKMMQDLIDAKNDIQMLSQRKLEVEHNLRTSQFRENEATVFLRQFRRFYRRLLRNKAAQGTGDTGEITAKVPGVPDLHDLIDVDTLLLESGLIEEEELHDDSNVGSYRPSSAALLRSTAAAKKAANEAAALEKAAGFERDEEGKLSYSSTVASSVRRRTTGSQRIAVDSESLEVINESGDVGVDEVSRSGNVGRNVDNNTGAEVEDAASNSTATESAAAVATAENVTIIGPRGQDNVSTETVAVAEPLPSRTQGSTDGGGADAGAGSGSYPASPSLTSVGNAVFVADSGNPQSITRGSSPYSASIITRRQMLLRTPSGRLTTMREKDLERDLLHMTERCIELQIALNEEKANVDVLTNRSGSLSKKRLAQEAISLRQALDRKTHDLQAIIWKMNELHLINKTYHEKMANREQHVTYLEENLVDLQNTNRRLVMEKQESEKKLHNELANLRELVDAMTVPLWQYGECGVTGRSLASRVILPVRGGEKDTDLDWDDAGTGEVISLSESSLSDWEEGVSEKKETGMDHEAGAAAAAALSASAVQKSRRHPRTRNSSTQTNDATLVNKGTMTEEKLAKSSTSLVDVGTMTVEQAAEVSAVLVDTGTMTDEQVAKASPELVDKGMMTDEQPTEASTEIADKGTMTDEQLAEAAAETVDTGTRTDDLPVETPVTLAEKGIMTDVLASEDKGTMTDLQPAVSTKAESVASKSGIDAGSQTDNLVEESNARCVGAGPTPGAAAAVGAAVGRGLANEDQDEGVRGGVRSTRQPTEQIASPAVSSGDNQSQQHNSKLDSRGAVEKDATKNHSKSEIEGRRSVAVPAAVATGATAMYEAAVNRASETEEREGAKDVSAVSRAASVTASTVVEKTVVEPSRSAPPSSSPSALNQVTEENADKYQRSAAANVDAGIASKSGKTGDVGFDNKGISPARQGIQQSSAVGTRAKAVDNSKTEFLSKARRIGHKGEGEIVASGRKDREQREGSDFDKPGRDTGRTGATSATTAAVAVAASSATELSSSAPSSKDQKGTWSKPIAAQTTETGDSKHSTVNRTREKLDDTAPLNVQSGPVFDSDRDATRMRAEAVASSLQRSSLTGETKKEEPLQQRLTRLDEGNQPSCQTSAVTPREVLFESSKAVVDYDDYEGTNSHSSLGRASTSPGQLPDGMFPGGKSINSRPRRFVRKLGPTIKPGVLKESKKKHSERSGSLRESTTSSIRAPSMYSSSVSKSAGAVRSRMSRDH